MIKLPIWHVLRSKASSESELHSPVRNFLLCQSVSDVYHQWHPDTALSPLNNKPGPLSSCCRRDEHQVNILKAGGILYSCPAVSFPLATVKAVDLNERANGRTRKRPAWKTMELIATAAKVWENKVLEVTDLFVNRNPLSVFRRRRKELLS